MGTMCLFLFLRASQVESVGSGGDRNAGNRREACVLTVTIACSVSVPCDALLCSHRIEVCLDDHSIFARLSLGGNSSLVGHFLVFGEEPASFVPYKYCF